MHRRLLLVLICCLAGSIPAPGARAQVLIDKGQAVAAARRDVGTGACGSFIQYKSQGAPPQSRQDAEALLNKPASDTMAIERRLSRLVERVNLRNGQTGFVEGDFTGAMNVDQYFPYSASPMADPGGRDVEIAMRLRGYFNVSSELAGKTVSFALNCDDFCSLRIGQIEVVPGIHITRSQRVVKQVLFNEPGLYPIEMIYFQTAGAAYLEWALSGSAEKECEQFCTDSLADPQVYGGRFSLVPTERLYSSIVGESRACQECGAGAAECSSGRYCGDGLCQDCNVADHCGPTCARCPADARICSAGACVQCTRDSQCGALVCEEGRCVQPKRCTGNGECKSYQNCDSMTATCRMPPPPCTTNAMCEDGQLCNGQFCYLPSMRCTSNAQCAESHYCDPGEQVCKARFEDRYSGGLAGCSLGGGPSQGGPAAGWFALLGLLGGVMLRARRAHRARAAVSRG
jgi:outer membrane exchange protein TraA